MASAKGVSCSFVELKAKFCHHQQNSKRELLTPWAETTIVLYLVNQDNRNSVFFLFLFFT